jgi:hypothetical protein
VFLGHFAAGFAAKKLTPYTSLGTPLLSAQFLDLLWPTLLMLDVEQVRVDPGNTAVTPLAFVSYPWSHSLLMAIAWGLAVAAVYVFFRRYPPGAITAFALVVSHWVFDLIAHRPDLPLLPWGGPVVGLGLWNSLPGTVAVEAAMFAVGLYLYEKNTEPVDATGTYALAAFGATLVVIYGVSLAGPPPPDATVVAYVAQAQWLLVIWGYWLDRHRVAIRQW